VAHVALHGVTKQFGGITAVSDVSLEVADREFLVLVGPSGCGKTTLLRMIAGLDSPTSGDILIGGRRVNDTPARDRDVAVVFQNYALYPHMSVFDNMAFPLKMRKVSASEQQRRVTEAAELLAIAHLLKRKPKELSGGERQRVALGRAIVREPQVFLMDEPLSNLDAKLRLQTRSELVKLQRRLGATVIYVTHDQSEAMTMGDRIAVLNGGALQQAAPPEEVYQQPANTFVAGFFGSPGMNFLPGTVKTAAGALGVETSAGFWPLPPALTAIGQAWQGKPVIAGVRPEHFRTAGEAAGGGFQAAVDLVEQLGSEKLLHMTVAEHTLVARVAPETPVRAGETIALHPDMQHLHLFDPSDGRALC
jgi:multiple sugar transport system ATP-binding protein